MEDDDGAIKGRFDTCDGQYDFRILFIPRFWSLEDFKFWFHGSLPIPESRNLSVPNAYL